MSTFNYRYAQAEGQTVAPSFAFNYQNQANQPAQSPGTYNNAQTAPANASPQQAPNSQTATSEQGKEQANLIETLDKQSKEVKQFVTNHFRALITANNITSDAITYKWIQRFFGYIGVKFRFDEFVVNLLENRFDKLLNQTRFGNFISDPEIVKIFTDLKTSMINKIPKINEFRAVANRVKELKAFKTQLKLSSYKNLENILDNIDNLSATKKASIAPIYDQLLLYKKALESANPAEAQNILKNIDNYIKNDQNKRLFQLLSEENKSVAKSISNFSKTVENDARTLEPMAKNLKLLGDDPSTARKMAVNSFTALGKIFRQVEFLKPLIGLADFLTGPSVGRNLAVLDSIISTADFLQWVIELNTGVAKLDFSVNVVDDKEQFKKNIYFILSASKMVTSILQFVPGINAFFAPIDMVLGLLQNDAVMDKLIDTGVSAGVYVGGMGWGGAEKLKEVERINEQAYGTPPSNPDAKIVYDWILQNANTGKLIFQDVYRLKKMSLSESQTYADMAIEYFRKNAPGNILEQANVRKMLGLVNWVNNDGDTRYIELRNSLLAVCSNIIKDAVQSVRDEMSGKTNRQQAQNQAQQQQPTTANKVYNNRRYVICPST